MKYMGSKWTIRKWIASYINKATAYYGLSYYEPFVGFGSVVSEVVPSGLTPYRYASDGNAAVIRMWKHAQKHGSKDFPEEFDAESHRVWRESKELFDSDPHWAFLVLACSFAGTGNCVAQDSKGTNYVLQQKRSLARRLVALQDVRFFYSLWEDASPPLNRMVIYCDPPYHNTYPYKFVDSGRFDYFSFLNKLTTWTNNHMVLLSGYESYRDDWVVFAEKKVYVRITDNPINRSYRAERLFVHKSQKDMWERSTK